MPSWVKEVTPAKAMLFDESRRWPECFVPSEAVMVVSVLRVPVLVVTVPNTGTFCNCREPVKERKPVEATNFPLFLDAGALLIVMDAPVLGSVIVKGAKEYLQAPVVVLMEIETEIFCEAGPINKALSVHPVTVPASVLVTVLSGLATAWRAWANAGKLMLRTTHRGMTMASSLDIRWVCLYVVFTTSLLICPINISFVGRVRRAKSVGVCSLSK